MAAHLTTRPSLPFCKNFITRTYILHVYIFSYIQYNKSSHIQYNTFSCMHYSAFSYINYSAFSHIQYILTHKITIHFQTYNASWCIECNILSYTTQYILIRTAQFIFVHMILKMQSHIFSPYMYYKWNEIEANFSWIGKT